MAGKSLENSNLEEQRPGRWMKFAQNCDSGSGIIAVPSLRICNRNVRAEAVEAQYKLQPET
jgi:hypothetical protein